MDAAAFPLTTAPANAAALGTYRISFTPGSWQVSELSAPSIISYSSSPGVEPIPTDVPALMLTATCVVLPDALVAIVAAYYSRCFCVLKRDQFSAALAMGPPAISFVLFNGDTRVGEVGPQESVHRMEAYSVANMRILPVLTPTSADIRSTCACADPVAAPKDTCVAAPALYKTKM